jgi:thiamine biosynthesis protein ThiS
LSLGEAGRPEIFLEPGRPQEPDPGNAGVGNGNKEQGRRILYSPFRERGFLFLGKNEMRLTVNGEAYCTEKDTVRELLGEMDIVPERVAVEVNLKVIKRAEYAEYKLQEGDSIEVVYFVGGGAQEDP